jgi:membrane-associated protease RseP (regulator of RpoE activity)
MKTRWFTLALLLVTTAAFADGPTRRTIIVKDGKVITDSADGPDFDILQRLDGELLSPGKRAHLGVRLTDLSSELRDHFGAPKDSGVLVASVEEDSPAEKAGVKVGDIIVGVDGKDVASSTDLRRALKDKKEGDSVRLEVLRGRSRQSLVASVVERDGGVRIFAPGEIAGLEGLRQFNSPEWKARIETLGDCGSLQSRIKELESRLKDLERKLQK